MTRSSYPSLAIVTPSYNQATFLEETILSVVNQNYPGVEYVIMDGGSTDGSVDIIHRYAHHLTDWVSEPDHGQYDAINKGFARTTGEIMGWINSDDKYTAWAFSVVGEIFARFPQVQWLTSAYHLIWNRHGQAVKAIFFVGFDRASFLRGRNLAAGQFIQQESTFWRRSLWERAGGAVDASFKSAGDFELWARFFQHADLYTVNALIGGFRSHGNQKSEADRHTYITEAEQVLRRYGHTPCGRAELYLHLVLRRVLPGLLRLQRIPPTMRPALNRLGLLYPEKMITWTERGWSIASILA